MTASALAPKVRQMYTHNMDSKKANASAKKRGQLFLKDQ